jgi:hypothetical protein
VHNLILAAAAADVLLLLPICSQALPLLQDVLPAVEALLLQLPQSFFKPLVQLSSLDGGQSDVLREVDAALSEEYKVRRRMLIERVKVGGHPSLLGVAIHGVAHGMV